MKILNKTLLVLLLICSVATQAREKRKYVNDYLNIGADARGISMSKSVIASTEDASATYWNPSLIVLNDYHLGLSTMYASYLGGESNFTFVGVSKKLNDESGAVGFTFLRMGTDNIPNTIYLIDESGVPNYNNVSYFSSADYLFQFTFSKMLGKHDSTANVKKALGFNLKLINRRASSFAKGWGVGGDIAYTMKWPKSTFAAVVRDATTTTTNWDINFTTEQQEILLQTGNRLVEKSSEVALPTILLGYGYRFDFSPKFSLGLETNLISTLDGEKNNVINLGNISMDPNFGAEFGYQDKIFLRGGVGNFQKQSSISDPNQSITTISPSLGGGVRLGKFGIDYAFSQMQNTEGVPFSHFISITARLDKNSKKTSAPMLEGKHTAENAN